MSHTNTITAPPQVREWVKDTWAKKVRLMNVGDELEIGSSEYMVRQSRYIGARRAFPGAEFSVARNAVGVYVITRIS